MQQGTKPKYEVLQVYPMSPFGSRARGTGSQTDFHSCFILRLCLHPLSRPTQKLVNFGARSNFRRCQHHPLSSFTPPPFPPVPGDPRTTPRTSSKSGDGLEDTINRIKTPSLSTNHPPILPSLHPSIHPTVCRVKNK